MNQIKSSIKVISILLVMMVCVSKVQSQVSIGVPVPSGSAMLDVSSTTKGFLPPRMSEIQRMLILKPEAGLIVYQTDNNKGLYYYDGTSWTYVINQVNNIAANSLLVGGGSASITGIEPGLAGNVLMSNGTSWIPQQLTFSNNQAGVVVIRDSIRAYGTVAAGPTFITTDYLNVGGYAAYLKTSRNIFGKPFNGTADLTSGLVSAGITSSSTLAVGTNATITGTLTTTGLTTLKGGLQNNGNATISGTLGVTENTTITGTLTLPSLSSSSLLVTNVSKGVASGSLTGDITTSGLTATLTNTGVISGTYGSSTSMPIVTVDAKGRITTISVTNTEIPDASLTTKGLVNTSTQSFAGNKTISGTLAVSGNTTITGTLGLTGLATTNGGLMNNGRLTNIGNATITGTLLVSTVSPTSTAAVLELSSTTQGFLPPRMSTDQRTAITNKVEGLTIWNTTNKQLEVYDGSYWVNMNRKLVSTINVGDPYGGGKVAYIFVPGDIGYIAGQTHGLIAANLDQTTDAGIKWFPNSFYDVTQTFLGQGIVNTISIIAASGTSTLTSYAAGLANSYRGGDYTDWYLPSKDELNKLYQNREAIGNFATSGLAAYWSSSQKGTFNFKDFTEYAKGISSAWVQLFFESGGEVAGTIKDLGISNLRRVRAVRVF